MLTIFVGRSFTDLTCQNAYVQTFSSIVTCHKENIYFSLPEFLKGFLYEFKALLPFLCKSTKPFDETSLTGKCQFDLSAFVKTLLPNRLRNDHTCCGKK